MRSFNLQDQTKVYIDCHNYGNDEYIILVKDIQNNYFSSKVIINRN